MWVWYNTARWWVRWLAMSLWLTLFLGLYYWALLLPRPHWWTPWPAWVTVLSLLVLGLAAGAACVLAHQPFATSYKAALDGLSKLQLRAVARARRRGPIPTDPAVLAGAVRVNDLVGTYHDRVSPTVQRVAWGLIAIGAVLLPITQFLDHNPRAGVLYLIVSCTMVAALLGPKLSRHRRRQHVAALRAAADAHPGVSAALALSPAAPVSRKREIRVRVGTAALVGIVTGVAATFVTIAGDHSCRTAKSAVRDIAEHWELLDPNGIAIGGPELAEYRAWSQRLQGYTEQVGEPVVESQLRQIAALSTDAVRIVEQTRTPGNTGGTVAPQDLYRDIAYQLIAADKRLLEDCTR